MRWMRIERPTQITHVDSGLIELRTLVGWVCSHCGHTNWAERHPTSGCWSCKERDDEYGVDAVPPADYHPEEVLRVKSPSRSRSDDD